jgi:Putative sensor
VSDTQVSSAQPRRSWLERFFGVIAELQTWKNLAYLLLAFPLGLFYFVFLVVGLSVGVALVIIWVGLPILAVTVLAWWAFANLERLQAEHLLGVPMTGQQPPWESDNSWWQRVKRHLGAARTWKDLAFLFVKFPLGIVSLVLVTVAIAVPAALIGAPFYYRYVDWTTNGVYHHGINLGAWHVDTLPEALVLVPIGIVLLFAALHLVNAFAKLSGILAGALLDEGAAAPLPPRSAVPSPQGPQGVPQPLQEPQGAAVVPAATPLPPVAPAPWSPPQAPPEPTPQATQEPTSPATQESTPQAPRPAPQPPVPPLPGEAPEAGH